MSSAPPSRINGAPALIAVCLTLADMDSYPDARRNDAEFLMAVQSTAMAAQILLAEGPGRRSRHLLDVRPALLRRNIPRRARTAAIVATAGFDIIGLAGRAGA